MSLEKYGILLNIDCDSTITGFLNAVSDKETVSENDLYPFVDVYRDSQVTDVLLNSFGQFSQTPSFVFSDFAFKYRQKTENGVPVDYSEWYRGNVLLHEKYGIDPFDVWFRRLREIGIRPWISVRMNDCHCPDDPTSFLRSEFFYEAKEKGWMVGDDYGYFRNCFNYAVPEVRARMLAYLREQLTRYDVFGTELDFEREIYCFDYIHDPECHKTMTAFLREARAIVREAEVAHGHKIVLAIRLGRDIEQNKIFGFDAEAIAEERLADMFIISPRLEASDSGMPVAEWKRRFPDMEIVTGMEITFCRWVSPLFSTPSVVRGYASEYLEEGADGIYLFNYFDGAESSERQEIYHTCGFPQTVNSLPRRFVVSYQDNPPKGCSAWRPLPLPADGRELYVPFGHAAERLALVFGLDSDVGIDTLASVTICGETFSAFETTEMEPCLEPRVCKDKHIPKRSLFRIVLPGALSEGKTALTVSFRSKDPQKTIEIPYLEIDTLETGRH